MSQLLTTEAMSERARTRMQALGPTLLSTHNMSGKFTTTRVEVQMWDEPVRSGAERARALVAEWAGAGVQARTEGARVVVDLDA